MSNRKDLGISYLLSLLGFVGFAGIHRFYLGKPVSGFFYLITMGFGGFGSIYDLIVMRRLVNDANYRLHVEAQMDDTFEETYAPAHPHEPIRPQAQSLEHLIFILAEENQGILSIAQLALESGVHAEQAQAELDKMVLQGYVTQGQRRNGLKVYVFQEFLTPSMRDDIIF